MPGLSGSAPVRVDDSLSQRLQACTQCHGSEGRATADGYFPRIAGKPAGYLYHQLRNFQQGRRQYAPMSHILEHLSDGYLWQIARHFAAQELPYPVRPPVSATPQQLQRGAQLARRGDPARGLPACTSCHGLRLTGVNPASPGLLGLSHDYLNAQLGAWRTGLRQAHPPDCMADIARRMAPDDIAAVTAWLTSQPLPVPATPQGTATTAAPLSCGSMPRGLP